MTEKSAELTQRLSAVVDKMPAFPKSVQRILEISRDINFQPKELVMVIEKDPVMTMKLLRIINSAYYSFPKQITSVSQSVVYLGVNTVKNMALSFAALGVLPRHNAGSFDIQRYLMHSLVTGSLARVLSQKFPAAQTDPNDCYIAGLLHDFGKVVFAQFMPDEFQAALALSAAQGIPLHVAERQMIGADHSVVGAMLVEKWQFPKALVEIIRNHHSEIASENTALCVLHVADQISKKLLRENAAGVAPEASLVLAPALIDRFGGDLDFIIGRLGDLTKIMEEAQSFKNASMEA
ncbi:MAG: HDOD domain-containing protein [Pseudomonadota bacterium]